jgi:hypothetical protein
VLKKASRKSDEADEKDFPADDPTGTMDRFSRGLRAVLSVRKEAVEPQRKVKRLTGSRKASPS